MESFSAVSEPFPLLNPPVSNCHGPSNTRRPASSSYSSFSSSSSSLLRPPDEPTVHRESPISVAELSACLDQYSLQTTHGSGSHRRSKSSRSSPVAPNMSSGGRQGGPYYYPAFERRRTNHLFMDSVRASRTSASREHCDSRRLEMIRDLVRRMLAESGGDGDGEERAGMFSSSTTTSSPSQHHIQSPGPSSPRADENSLFSTDEEDATTMTKTPATAAAAARNFSSLPYAMTTIITPSSSASARDSDSDSTAGRSPLRRAGGCLSPRSDCSYASSSCISARAKSRRHPNAVAKKVRLRKQQPAAGAGRRSRR